jgi:transposase
MGMLAEHADHVIGVDTHRDAHSAAAIATRTGALAAQTTVAADAFGYKRLLRFARKHAPRRRVWAIESSGSFGAGLKSFLLAHGEWVVEVDRPKRPARRNGAKSDELDAIRAAREALQREHLAQPRARGEREAIRVLLITRRGAIRARTKAINHLKALVVTAREELRDQLRNTPTDELVYRCARLRTLPSHSTEHRATVLALRHTARRILALEAEANDLETEIEQLIQQTISDLLAEVGVGPISAAQLYCSWSHRGRLRNDGASPCSAARPRFPPPRDRRSATASTAPATASSTAPCTRSSSPACSTTPLRAPTPPADSPRARPHAKSSAASSATSPVSSFDCSKPTVRTPFPPGARHGAAPSATALDRHRSLLATALAIKACQSGHRTLFATAQQWVDRLEGAQHRNSLDDELRKLDRYRLLVIDEIGYLPLERQAANLLFALIARRYERGSIIVTSNRGFEAWGEILGDAMVAAALIDRLVHHATMITLKGKSYRLRERTAATSEKPRQRARPRALSDTTG